MELAICKGVEIIDKAGLYRFSARQAARDMGYTVGTLYHVFGNLDGYMLHINGRILDEWHGQLSAGLKRNKGKDPLRYLVQAYIDFARQEPYRWQALFELRVEDNLPEWYGDKLARLFALVEDAIRPHVGAAAARREAKVLWAGIHGICVLSLTGKLDAVGAEKPETLAAALLEKFTV